TQSLSDLETIESVYDDLTMDSNYVLGNDDLDYISKQDFLDHTGMNAKYGSYDVGNFHFVILDAMYRSDSDSDDYNSGNFNYLTAYIPPSERTWLTADLAATTKKTIV